MKRLALLLPQSVAPERWGYLRPDGSWAMAPQFSFAWPFSEGVAAVYDDPGWECGPFLSGWKNDDELMNWFDRSGRIIAPSDR